MRSHETCFNLIYSTESWVPFETVLITNRFSRKDGRPTVYFTCLVMNRKSKSLDFLPTHSPSLLPYKWNSSTNIFSYKRRVSMEGSSHRTQHL